MIKCEHLLEINAGRKRSPKCLLISLGKPVKVKVLLQELNTEEKCKTLSLATDQPFKRVRDTFKKLFRQNSLMTNLRMTILASPAYIIQLVRVLDLLESRF